MTGVLPDLKRKPPSGLAHVAGDLVLMAETAAIFGLSGAQAAKLRIALQAGDATAAP